MAKYKVFAAIDVGSTAVSMKIAELSKKNGILPVDFLKRNLSLGGETYRVGKISYPLVEEICGILTEFVRVMAEYGVDDYHCIATTAVREASNSEYIIDQISLRTGIKVNILSNEEERFFNTKALFLPDGGLFQELIGDSALIVDVSSGSVQISAYEGSRLRFSKNIPMGSLRILELLSDLENKTTRFSDLLEEYIETSIRNYKRNFLKNLDYKYFVIFGWETGYIKMLCGKEKETYLTVGDFDRVYDVLSRKSIDEICDEYHIPYENAVLLLPAVLMYKKFFKGGEKKKIYAPETSIIDGICGDFAEKNGYLELGHSFPEDEISCARYCADKYNCDKKHYEAVTDFSVTIFQCLAKKFGLSKRDCTLLTIACILQETGLYMNINDYARYSYDIVRANKIMGLSEREHEAVACTVLLSGTGRHSGAAEYQSLPKNRKLLVSKLTAINALAQALDAGYAQKITKIKAVFKDGVLVITAASDKDITLENRQFSLASEFFEEVFGIRAELKKSRKFS